MLINPRAGDNFDRKQTEKELLEAITSKNEELAILHQVSNELLNQTLAWPTSCRSCRGDWASTRWWSCGSCSEWGRQLCTPLDS
jgi:lipopolysaccharide biosynthesis regulator YciM